MDFLLWFSVNGWRVLLFTLITVTLYIISLNLSDKFVKEKINRYAVRDSVDRAQSILASISIMCILILFISLIKTSNESLTNILNFSKYWVIIISLSLLTISFLLTLLPSLFLIAKELVVKTRIKYFIKDIFRPKWKNSDWNVRQKAISKINSPKLLCKMIAFYSLKEDYLSSIGYTFDQIIKIGIPSFKEDRYKMLIDLVIKNFPNFHTLEFFKNIDIKELEKNQLESLVNIAIKKFQSEGVADFLKFLYKQDVLSTENKKSILALNGKYIKTITDWGGGIHSDDFSPGRCGWGGSHSDSKYYPDRRDTEIYFNL